MAFSSICITWSPRKKQMETSHWGTRGASWRDWVAWALWGNHKKQRRAGNNAGNASPHHLEGTEESSTEPGQWGEDQCGRDIYQLPGKSHGNKYPDPPLLPLSSHLLLSATRFTPVWRWTWLLGWQVQNKGNWAGWKFELELMLQSWVQRRKTQAEFPCYSLEAECFSFLKTSIFALKIFNWLDEAHPDYRG